MARPKKQRDFQKTKLKVGRQISKGNVTNTAFKAKKIVLKEQMKNYVGEVNEKKDTNIIDLLKNLGLFNKSIKLNALRKIKDKINQADEWIALLPKMIPIICSKTADCEPEVRKEALNTICAFSTVITDVQMSPYYPILRSYVSNAITDIDVGVRKDSLKFLSLLLKTYPKSICEDNSILHKFLDLISYKQSSTKNSKKNKRVFSTSPGEQLTSQEWRIAVLKCFLQFLETNIRMMKETGKVEKPQQDDDMINIRNSVIIRKNFDFTAEEILGKWQKRVSNNNSITAENIGEFLFELSPLLCAIWNEAVPNCQYGETVPYEAHDAMTVLEVVAGLANYMNLYFKDNSSNVLDYFREVYYNIVDSAFLPKFPYSISHCMKQTRQLKLNLNLKVCEVFGLINYKSDKHSDEHYSLVLNYLLKKLKNKSLPVENFLATIEVLKLFVANRGSCDDCEEHFTHIFDRYCTISDRQQIRNMFFDFALNPEFQMLHKNKGFQMWVRYLPKEFLSITAENLQDFNAINYANVEKIAGRLYPAFLDGLNESSELVVEKLIEDTETQKTAALLVAKIPNISAELFCKLALATQNSNCSVANVVKLLYELGYRANFDENRGFELENYLNFLLNTIVGISSDNQVNWINKENEMFREMSEYVAFDQSKYIIVPSTDWGRHKEIVDVAILGIQGLPNQDSVRGCVETFFKIFLSSIKHLPLHSAAAVMDIYTNLISGKSMDGLLKMKIFDLAQSYFLFEMALALSNVKVTRSLVRSEKLADFFSCIGIPETLQFLIMNISLVHEIEHAKFFLNILLQSFNCVNLMGANQDMFIRLINAINTILQTDIREQTWFIRFLSKLNGPF